MIELIIMIAIMAVVAIITSAATVKSRNPGIKFDERQIIGRGKAAEAGFYTLMLSLLCYVFYHESVAEPLLPPAIGIGLCIIAGAAAFAMVGIIKDAFVERSGTVRGKIILFSILGACNILLSVLALIDGRLIENGKLDVSLLNIAVGVMSVLVVISLSVKAAMQKKSAALEAGDDE